ncbi:MAG: hypothetical protein HOI23_08370 [Deltaproteobacteria bacterium]|jgi:tetratricopeptide (TPR) repeat protein|nr:hypothetical protein [Deltaproteobacteria bacterium]MBT6435859.1 hypothetical protein [Deltaproteobacteria bacterium]
MMRTLSIALFLTLLIPQIALGSVNQGHALLEAWQLEEAKLLAQELLLENPSSSDAYILAGRVQYFRGEHLSALGLLEKAQALGGPKIGGLFDRVQDTARYAPYFQTLETKHFKIRYIDKDVITATYAKDVLEAAYREIGGGLDFLAAERDEKIVVEIYPDALGLAAATGLTVGEIETSGTIAVAKYHRLMITSPLGTANGYSWADTIAHEFTHLVISKKSRNTIPIWFHEGIAKYYETLWRGEAGLALTAFSEKLLAEATRDKAFITFDQMHPSMAKLPSQEATALAFAEVFTVVEYLRQTHGVSSIPKVLELTGAGLGFEAALKKVFGSGLGRLEKKWQNWVKKRKFTLVPGARAQTIALKDSKNASSKEEDPLEALSNPDAQRFSRLGELLQMRDKHAAAAIEYEKARLEVGERYPTLNYRLAKAYSHMGKDDQAVSLLTKSFVIHPDDTDGRLLAGRLELKRGGYDAAEGHFDKVKLRNPYNPELHGSMASIYKHRNNAPQTEQSLQFFKLCQAQRERHSFDLPLPTNLTSGITILGPRFETIRIMGQPPIELPTIGLSLEPGNYSLEFRDAKGETKVQDVLVTPTTSLVVLK